jgi:hypothetical protein
MPNTPGPDAPLTSQVSAAHIASAAALGHEPHRVNITAVLWCGAALAGLGVLVHFVMSGFLALIEPATPRPTTIKLPRTVLPQDVARIRPPVLQASNDDDMKSLREKEKTLLRSYRWVDREKGIVRIPIEEAIKMLVKEKGR